MKNKNFVIKNQTKETGKKIIQYFKSLGVNTEGYIGDVCERDGDLQIYYGVIDGTFSIYTYKQVMKHYAEIIEFPVEPKRGDLVYVSSDLIHLNEWNDTEKEERKRIYITIIEGAREPTVVVNRYYEEEFYSGKPFKTLNWKYMMPIPKEKEKIYTVEDLVKKTGLSKEALRKILE